MSHDEKNTINLSEVKTAKGLLCKGLFLSYSVVETVFCKMIKFFSSHLFFRFDAILDPLGGETPTFSIDLLKSWMNAKYISLVMPLLPSTDRFGIPGGLIQSATDLSFNVLKVCWFGDFLLIFLFACVLYLFYFIYLFLTCSFLCIFYYYYFLAHLSWRLRMSFCDHLPSVSLHHTFEGLLSRNPGASFLQISWGVFY